jgi:hypothetical protein
MVAGSHRIRSRVYGRGRLFSAHHSETSEKFAGCTAATTSTLALRESDGNRHNVVEVDLLDRMA